CHHMERLLSQDRIHDAIAFRAELGAAVAPIDPNGVQMAYYDLLLAVKRGSEPLSGPKREAVLWGCLSGAPGAPGIDFAEIVVAVGDRGHVAMLYERLAELGDCFGCSVFSMSCREPLSHPLGILATSLERHDEAVAHFERALSRCE